MSIYKQIILEHAQNPKNIGKIKNPNYTSFVKNAMCGDEIHVDITASKEKIKDIKFHGVGCIVMKAGASLICDHVKKIGSIKIVNKMTEEDALNLFGEELTPSRQKCALLTLTAIKKALS